jgi:hypothetical protein
VNNEISNNSTEALLFPVNGTTEVYAYGNSFDANGPPAIAVTGGAGGGRNIFHSIGNHLENLPPNAGAASGHITVGNNATLSPFR